MFLDHWQRECSVTFDAPFLLVHVGLSTHDTSHTQDFDTKIFAGEHFRHSWLPLYYKNTAEFIFTMVVGGHIIQYAIS